MKGKLVDFSWCQLHFFAISLFQIASHHKQTSNPKPFNSCICNGDKIELCSRTSPLLKPFIHGKRTEYQIQITKHKPKNKSPKIKPCNSCIHAQLK
jgi:hypothetical protein